VLAAWLWLIVSCAIFAQASLSGTVVNAVTGDPVKRVAVTLNGASAHDSPATLSDGTGKFFFAAVTPGRYRSTAEKAPFLRWAHGQRKPLAAGTSLELASGEQRTGIAIRLVPGAAISGRVTDEDSKSAVGAQVTLLRVTYLNGRRQLGAVAHAAVDDRDEYRLHSIPPGRFLLRANFERFFLPARVSQKYLGSYHPAADLPDRATWLTGVAAAELTAVDVTLRPTAAHRIAGTVVDANTGQAVRDAIVMLSATTGDEGPGRGFVRNELGTFTVPAIPPGSYTITATRSVAGQLAYGRTVVDVSRDIDNLRVGMEPGLRVEGRVRMEGDGSVDLSKATVALESNELLTFGGRSPIDADGAFAIGPMASAIVVPQVMNLESVFLREVRVNERPVEFIDLTALSCTVRLDLVMSGDGAVIEGGVGNAVGAIVVLEPQSAANFRRSRYRATKSDQAGKFKLIGIAPGDYRLYAFEDIDDGAWLDSNYMGTFSAKGELVKVSGKETRSIGLTMIAGGQ